MMTSSIFNILEIEETRDEDLIKNAYRTKLVTVNPEDNPEGFVRLREAYEEALRLSKEADSPEWANDTPVGRWTQQIDDIYTHLDKRMDVTCWGKLFEDAFFRDIDTEDEAKKALLSYLTRHYYLPMAVWKLIDDVCEIEEKIDEYTELFPRDFLSFIINSKTHELPLPLELFTGSPNAEYDNYIQTYFSLRNIITAEDTSRADMFFDELEHANISHPYLLCERIRFAVKKNDSPSIRKWIEEYENNLSSFHDSYLFYVLALAHWALGKYDVAENYAQKVLEASPEHFGAQKLLCDYHSQNGEYKKAHESYMQLFEINPFDADLIISFQKNLPFLIKQRQQSIAENPTTSEIIELCWNYLQSAEHQKALDTLLSVTPETEEDMYSYTNILGRLYFHLNQFEEALPHLLKWKEYIYTTIDDHSEKAKKRLTRKGTVNFFLAQVWCSIAEISKAEEDYTIALSYYDAAIKFERPPRNLEYKNRRAALLLAAGQNEECVDYCNGQIAENGNFLPFYVLRQQASYNLNLGQDVINDFHLIVRIAPKIPQSYALAADVYLKSGQYKESLNIIEQAHQANIESPKLRLIAITVRRLESTDRQVTKGCISDLYVLNNECRKMDPKDCDIENLTDIGLQICYAQMDLFQYDDAQYTIERLISDVPDNDFFVRVLSDIFCRKNLLFDAEIALTVYLKRNPNTISVLISLGDVYTKAGKYDLALATYENILSLSPTHVLPYKMMNKIYLQKNTLSAKAEYLEKALELANKQITVSDDPENVFQRGITYLDIGDLNSAIKDFKKIIEVDSQQTSVYYGFLGDAYKFQRDFDTALEHYLHAYKLYNGTYNFHACKDLSVCYESMHRYDEALEMLDIINKNQPGFVEAFNSKARIYIKMKNYQKALYSYMMAMQNADSLYLRAESYRNTLICYLLMNDHASARATIKNTEFKRDANPIHCQTCGDYSLYVKKSSKKAIMHYTNGYVLSKSRINAWEAENTFAVEFLRIYHDQKKKRKIKKHRMQFFDALNAKFGDLNGYLNNPHERKLRCFLVGCVLYYSGETEEARKLFDQMNTGKNCISCSYNKCVKSIAGRAMLLEADGQYEEAISCYEEVIAEGYACEQYISHIQKLKKKAKMMS